MFSRTAPGGEGGEERIRRGDKEARRERRGREGGSKGGKRLVKGGIGKRGRGR